MGVKHISEVTRRDIATLFVDGYYDYSIYWPDSKDSSPDDAKIFYPYCGRLTEVEFLKRLYPIDKMPSTDSRYPNAEGDIWQHTVNNDDWDRYVLLKENDMNKQMIQIEEELYKSVYLSECLFDKDVYDKLENINNAFCKVAQSYKNMLVANLSNLSSQDDAQEFLSLFRECLLSSSPTAVQDYNEALSQKQPKTYEALMAFAKEAQAYTDLVYKSGILSDIKKYIRVDMLDS